MKKRGVGYRASTHVRGDRADDPAGSLSDQLPTFPVAAYGSLPGTRCAPPSSAQPGCSKSPRGESSYHARSAQGTNGWRSTDVSHVVGSSTSARAADGGSASTAARASADKVDRLPRKRGPYLDMGRLLVDGK